ncbi:MAG: hypothetical protein Q9159_004332 [Coniocarpon cinnabarinum]
MPVSFSLDTLDHTSKMTISFQHLVITATAHDLIVWKWQRDGSAGAAAAAQAAAWCNHFLIIPFTLKPTVVTIKIQLGTVLSRNSEQDWQNDLRPQMMAWLQRYAQIVPQLNVAFFGIPRAMPCGRDNIAPEYWDMVVVVWLRGQFMILKPLPDREAYGEELLHDLFREV